MIIDVRSFDRAHGRLSGDVETRIEDPAIGDLTVPCRVEVDYRQAHGMVYLHGAVTGAVDTRCHRCLDPVRSGVAGEFDLMVRRGGDGEPGDDVIVLAPNEHEISLEPYIHETVVVNMPMVVVCADDCRGLCPVCGANRNRVACGCTVTEDSRWDELRKLKHE